MGQKEFSLHAGAGFKKAENIAARIPTASPCAMEKTNETTGCFWICQRFNML
jgi:hypothetical protein